MAPSVVVSRPSPSSLPFFHLRAHPESVCESLSSSLALILRTSGQGEGGIAMHHAMFELAHIGGAIRLHQTAPAVSHGSHPLALIDATILGRALPLRQLFSRGAARSCLAQVTKALQNESSKPKKQGPARACNSSWDRIIMKHLII